jgi:hypothetical protein
VSTPEVARVEYDAHGLCRAYTASSDLVSQFPTVYELAFNSQYGTPLSPDGRRVFIGNWYRGLFCYSTVTGDLLWHKGPGKVRMIVPTADHVIVEMCDRGIYKRDLSTGELVAQVKMTAIEILLPISGSEILAGPTRGSYSLYSIPNLRELQRITSSLLDPTRCLSVTIREAEKKDNLLVVRGWEEYPGMDDSKSGVTRFERFVALTHGA